MALYKYQQYIGVSQHEAFDAVHQPGTPAPYSGIFRCENCGDEYACNKDNPLPTQNHKQHNPANGPIRWKLIVFPVVR